MTTCLMASLHSGTLPSNFQLTESHLEVLQNKRNTKKVVIQVL
jgi:hypothetical protein